MTKFLRRLFRRPANQPQPATQTTKGGLMVQREPEDHTSLGWLADAPLFIDASQVSSFYDAVVRPETKEGTITLSTRSLKGTTTHVEAGGEVKVGISKLIKTWFPFLDAEATLSGSASRDQQSEQEKSESIELHPIDTPQRQLVQLALHYAINLPGRMKIVLDANDTSWSDPAYIAEVPRALIFMDLSSETIFIPTAAELASGKVILFYPDVVGALKGTQDPAPPSYPQSQAGVPEAALLEPRRNYWNWFQERFAPDPVMRIVETIVGDGGPISWIDFRVPTAADGTTVHLHLSGRKTYETGVFAYNLIKRGYKHGLRLVGTLKSEPDMNVLAVFDK